MTPPSSAPTTRAITLPALGRQIPLRIYVAAIKLAKANPDREFKHGLTTWWPTTGSEIMKQFNQGVTKRINEAVPYVERGRAPGGPS